MIKLERFDLRFLKLEGSNVPDHLIPAAMNNTQLVLKALEKNCEKPEAWSELQSDFLQMSVGDVVGVGGESDTVGNSNPNGGGDGNAGALVRIGLRSGEWGEWQVRLLSVSEGRGNSAL